MKKSSIYYCLAFFCFIVGIFWLVGFYNVNRVVACIGAVVFYAGGLTFAFLVDRCKKQDRLAEQKHTLEAIQNAKYLYLFSDPANQRKKRRKKPSYYLEAYHADTDVTILKRFLFSENEDDELSDQEAEQLDAWQTELAVVDDAQLSQLTGKTIFLSSEDHAVLQNVNELYYFLRNNTFITERDE